MGLYGLVPSRDQWARHGTGDLHNVRKLDEGIIPCDLVGSIVDGYVTGKASGHRKTYGCTIRDDTGTNGTAHGCRAISITGMRSRDGVTFFFIPLPNV